MRVLVIEDEPDLLSVVMQALRETGYAVDGAADGREGLFKARAAEYDALVLDLMLPGIDGWSLLKELRKTHTTPVLLLTARDSLPDRVRGALIRRSAGKASSLISFADITLDTATRTATKAGETISLTPREYALVEFLALHKGKLVTRTMIYDHLFDEDDDTLSNLVDVHVSNVRRKLGKDFITTRRGEGYFIHA
jgi:two-component system OmpR family response regulator